MDTLGREGAGIRLQLPALTTDSYQLTVSAPGTENYQSLTVAFGSGI